MICGLVVMFFYTAGIVRATDFSMKCDEKKCTPASISRFFDEGDLWYPTYSLSNVVTIENKSTDSQFVGHRAFNIQTSEGADIAEALELVIVRNSVNKQVWQSSLAEFYTTSEAVLGVLGPGKTDSFEYTISMKKDAGNEYQGKKTQFDLVFGYFMPTVTPTPTATPTPTNTPIPTPTSVIPTEELNATSSGQVQGVSEEQEVVPKPESTPIKKVIYATVGVGGVSALFYFLITLKKI